MLLLYHVHFVNKELQVDGVCWLYSSYEKAVKVEPVETLELKLLGQIKQANMWNAAQVKFTLCSLLNVIRILNYIVYKICPVDHLFHPY